MSIRNSQLDGDINDEFLEDTIQKKRSNMIFHANK